MCVLIGLGAKATKNAKNAKAANALGALPGEGAASQAVIPESRQNPVRRSIRRLPSFRMRIRLSPIELFEEETCRFGLAPAEISPTSQRPRPLTHLLLSH